MIVDLEKTTNFISGWIEACARQAKAKSLVVGLSGGVDSALVLALALKTNLPVHAVLLPCHSSDSASVRAEEAISALNTDNLSVHVIDLRSAFSSINEQVVIKPDLYDKNAAEGALRSTLRAPALDYIAKLYGGIIVGTGNRDEDEVTRYYQKRGDGAVDVSPIAKLHKSEVYQLAAYLNVPKSILEARPSADLWGPDSGQEDERQLGMTYKQIEETTRLVESIYETTSGAAFLQLAKSFKKFGLAAETVSLLETLGKMELASRHKANPAIPVCDVRVIGAGMVE